MRDEIIRLKVELGRSSGNSGDLEQGSDDEPLLKEEEEECSLDQRLLVKTLKSMERRSLDAKFDLPTYDGKMDPDAAMDWVNAVTSFFECKTIPENQKVKIAKSRLRGFALVW